MRWLSHQHVWAHYNKVIVMFYRIFDKLTIVRVTICIGIVIIFIILFAPKILEICCNIDCNYYFSVWDAEIVLQYIGSSSTTIGTVMLGICTVLINRRVQENNEKLMSITEQNAIREAQEQIPLVGIVKHDMDDQGNKNIKIRVIYDQLRACFRVTIWVHHFFSYAIRSVKVQDARFGLADNSLGKNTIELDSRKELLYIRDISYINEKALLPQQETVFSMYFKEKIEIEELHDNSPRMFCLEVKFENENNSALKLREQIKISCKGRVGLEADDFELYSEEVCYQWIDDQ